MFLLKLCASDRDLQLHQRTAFFMIKISKNLAGI